MEFKIFINFKTYPQGTGERAVRLAREIREVQEGLEGRGGEITVIPIVQVADVLRIKQAVEVPVWVQHVDFQPQGQFTGWINLEAVIEAGASGCLLNHSEHRIPPGTVKQILGRVRGVGDVGENKRFEVMVCCKTLGQMERLAKLKPDYIGYEVSELIGGKVSIVDYNPTVIKHAAEICGQIPLIIGAGIHQAEDLKKARSLGAKGVLISSAVVLAENPGEKLGELIANLRDVHF
ncbi:MAG: triose-phosphate isomerase [Microgenomates group bacterium]